MINQTEAGKLGCNRIMFTSADKKSPVSHYFTLPTEVRETSIESMSKQSYKHGFVEPESQYCANIICLRIAGDF